MGFISTDSRIGAYFGPHIFTGTPFEQAPVLEASFDFDLSDGRASVAVEVAGHRFEASLRDLQSAVAINRDPAETSPFIQQGVERKSEAVGLKVNGKDVPLSLPPVGLSGGPAAVFAPCGIYVR